MSIAKIYEQYRSELFLFAYKIIKDQHAAQDIVQNCFIEILKNNYDNPEKVLYTIVKNKCLNYLRDRVYTTDIIPEQIDYRKEEKYARLTGILHKHIQRLPRKQRVIVTMFMEGYTINEISNTLNLSNKSILNRKALALSSLRESLKKFL